MTKRINTTTLTKDDKLLHSVPEAAFLLGVCDRTIYNLIREKELLPKRIGSRVFVTREALEKFVKK